MTHSPIATTARPGPRPTLGAWTVLALLAAAVSSPAVLAQTCESWVNEGDTRLPGVDGVIYTMNNWDPDGEGGAPNLVVLGGSFGVAGDAVAHNVATWDPVSGVWGALGEGLEWSPQAIEPMPNGRLVAVGYADHQFGTAPGRVAIWDGAHWQDLGSADAEISTVTVLPDSRLVVGGRFTRLGAATSPNVAMWNGGAWESMGAGVPPGAGRSGTDIGVHKVVYLPQSGTVAAVGTFANATCRALARWNGSEWSQFGPITDPTSTYYEGYTACLDRSGVLHVMGRFSRAFDSYQVMSWSGAAWTVDQQWGDGTTMIAYSPENTLAMSFGSHWHTTGGSPRYPGYFQGRVGGVDRRYYTDCLGTYFENPFNFNRGSGAGPILYLPDGSMLIAGAFTSTGTASTSDQYNSRYQIMVPTVAIAGLARVTAQGIVPISADRAPYFGHKLLPTSGGIMFAAVGGSQPDGIYQKTPGEDWQDTGVPRIPRYEYNALQFAPFFTSGLIETRAGSLVITRAWDVRRRDSGGSQWTSVGTPHQTYQDSIPQVVDAVELPNGRLVVAGGMYNWYSTASQNIRQWDGQNWVDVGGGVSASPFNVSTVRLALTPSGHLIAAGNFAAAGGVANTNGIARWDGSAWNSVAPGTNSGILAIAVRPNGNIIATGSFTALGGTPVNRIAEWDGSAWRPFGSGLTEPAAQGRAIALAPNGDVILGGHFAAVGGIAADNVARWNGHAWRAVGDGLGFPGDTPSTDEGVNDLKFDPATGDLWAAGTFVASGGRLVMGIARVTLATQYADITQQPTPAAGCPGEPASFTIRVQSAAPVTYRWSHNGAPIDSATNPSALSDTLVIPAVAPADAGEYRCTVTDGCTSTPSTPATLTYLACCPDFDLDGNADQADVWYLINAVTGGPNPSGRDLDFNHDGSTDMTDVDALVNTIAGAGCP